MRDHLLPFSTFFSFLHSSNIIFENFSFWRESDAEREPLERVRLLYIWTYKNSCRAGRFDHEIGILVLIVLSQSTDLLYARHVVPHNPMKEKEREKKKTHCTLFFP